MSPMASKFLAHQVTTKYECACSQERNSLECAIVFQIALKLTQMQGPSREFRQPLLDVIIRNIHADVVDRKWDTQGSVTMGNITVLDYITVGTCV